MMHDTGFPRVRSTDDRGQVELACILALPAERRFLAGIIEKEVLSDSCFAFSNVANHTAAVLWSLVLC